jgi:hypothetical protein
MFSAFEHRSSFGRRFELELRIAQFLQGIERFGLGLFEQLDDLRAFFRADISLIRSQRRVTENAQAKGQQPKGQQQLRGSFRTIHDGSPS